VIALPPSPLTLDPGLEQLQFANANKVEGNKWLLTGEQFRDAAVDCGDDRRQEAFEALSVIGQLGRDARRLRMERWHYIHPRDHPGDVIMASADRASAAASLTALPSSRLRPRAWLFLLIQPMPKCERYIAER
jgi:hypothetical protein